MENKKRIIAIAIVIFMCLIIGIIIAFENKEEYTEIMDYEVLDTTGQEDKKEVKETIKIHISGEVNYNGILELEDGSRIDDAIKQAGGITPNADINKINLAYELSDGQKLYIPNIDEEENITYITENSGLEEQENAEKININKATQTELETLPGVGPSLALKIIKYRKEKGKFKSIEELKNVSGVGENKYEQLKELVKVK